MNVDNTQINQPSTIENPTQENKRSKKKMIVWLCILGTLVIGVISGVFSQITFDNNIDKIKSYVDTRKYEEAKELLDELKSSNRSQARVYLAYADYYVALNEYSNAIEILETGKTWVSNSDSIEIKISEIKTKYKNELNYEEETKKQQAALEEKENQEKIEKDKAAEKQRKEDERNAYVDKCKTITYKDLARNPNKQKGEFFTFTGEVIQVVEPTSGEEVSLRINVTKSDYGNYSDTIYATIILPEGEDRILEDDIIKIYGECKGMKTYTSVAGSNVSVPEIKIKYYELVN